MEVRKRDGSVEAYSRDKLLLSLTAAALATVNEEFRDENTCNSMLSVLGIDGNVETDCMREVYTRGTLGDDLYESLELVVDLVETSLDEMGEIVSTHDLSDLVHTALVESGQNAILQEYVMRAMSRERAIESASALMRVVKELTFTNSQHSNAKRDNANVNGETAMGTMLQYGAASSKSYALMFLMAEHIAELHRKGGIHIHDMDFYSLTLTCITKESRLIIRRLGKVEVIQAQELDHILAQYADDTVVPLEEYEVFSNGRFVKIKNIVRHKSQGKKILQIQCPTTDICVTSDHVVAVANGTEWKDVMACDLKRGMQLVPDGLCIADYTKNTLDLIDMLKDSNKLMIYNSSEVVADIKKSKKAWREFCDIHSYKTPRGRSLQTQASRMTIAEFVQIEHLTSLSRKELTLCSKHARYGSTIKAIVPLTSSLGRYIGYMLSNGTFTQKSSENLVSVSMTTESSATLQAFKTVTEKIFINPYMRDIYGYRGSKYEKVVVGVTLQGGLNYALFDGAFAKRTPSGELRLPDWVFSANKPFIAGLLEGLLDGVKGYAQSNGCRVGYEAGSKELAKDIRDLLALREIPTVTKVDKVQEGTVEQGVTSRSRYYINVVDQLKEKLGFLNAEKLKHIELTNYVDNLADRYVITDIKEVDYEGYVYDMETENHYFSVNGVMVHNCCQINLEKLFDKGFNTGHGFIRPPASIESYAALTCIVIQSNQNDQHGGQSIPALDHYLEKGVSKTIAKEVIKYISEEFIKKYVITIDDDSEIMLPPEIETRKYKMENTLKDLLFAYIDEHRYLHTYAGKQYVETLVQSYLEEFELNFNLLWAMVIKETMNRTRQAMESLVHNLNSMHSRAGAQIPFSSINFGTATSWEGRLISSKFLDAVESGLGKGETPIFPISIFKLKKGVNVDENDPNYDLFKKAIHVTARRMYPNFSNLDAPFNKQYYKKGNVGSEVAYMGCRTRVMADINGENEVEGRGNLSFTTINLPQIALLTRDITEFYSMLLQRMNIVLEQLLSRTEIVSHRRVANMPFLMQQHIWKGTDDLKPDDEIAPVLKYGTISIGFAGLAEALVALVGKHHGEDEDAQKLGYEIISYMRKFCDDKSVELGMNVTLLATPAESACGRFLQLDRKQFGIVEGVTDHEYYTNSFHVPVWYKTTARHKVEVEAPYHELTNAGHITYVELDGDASKNEQAVEDLVMLMYKKNCGYFAVSHAIEYDPVCGYTGYIGEGNPCPRCGRYEFEDVPFEKRIY